MVLKQEILTPTRSSSTSLNQTDTCSTNTATTDNTKLIHNKKLFENLLSLNNRLNHNSKRVSLVNNLSSIINNSLNDLNFDVKQRDLVINNALISVSTLSLNDKLLNREPVNLSKLTNTGSESSNESSNISFKQQDLEEDFQGDEDQEEEEEEDPTSMNTLPSYTFSISSSSSSSPSTYSSSSNENERKDELPITPVSCEELINEHVNSDNLNVDLTVIHNPTEQPIDGASVIDEDDEDENNDDENDEDNDDVLSINSRNFPKNDQCTSTPQTKTSLNKSIKNGTSTISSANSLNMACEVASLSSLTSNYSQFDFLTDSNRISPNINNNANNMVTPPNPAPNFLTNTNAKKQKSFFFSNGLFGNKKHKDVLESTITFGTKNSVQLTSATNITNTTPTSSSTNTFDIITSKFFNFKQSGSTKSSYNITSSNGVNSTESSCSSTSSNSSSYAFKSTSNELVSDNISIKTNHSANSLANICNLNNQVPSSVLIFENRPSNLPAKSQQEALKHKQEYEKMVEIAKKKEQKEKELKLKKYEQQMKKEDFMANSLKIWNNEILANWEEQKNAKRTQQLWWHGLPPSIRGKVWKLAIGNELNLTKESFYFYEKKAKQKLDLLKKSSTNSSQNDSDSMSQADKSQESSVELIKLDVSRTFPQLCFFQKDGPYHDALHSVLGAYACYNTSIGYVQGMSFLTAILLLNMEAPDAFICLSNILTTKYLLACFCMDQTKMNRHFKVHQILLEHNIPKLYNHFEEQKVKPDLYLIEWIFTLFSKSLPLDVMSRVWDVLFRDKERFLFRTALGILNLYKETLLEMDFIHIVQFLTKLPENINATQLFKSIEQINLNIDDNYFTFENLISEIIENPSGSYMDRDYLGTNRTTNNH